MPNINEIEKVVHEKNIFIKDLSKFQLFCPLKFKWPLDLNKSEFLFPTDTATKFE